MSNKPRLHSNAFNKAINVVKKTNLGDMAGRVEVDILQPNGVVTRTDVRGYTGCIDLIDLTREFGYGIKVEPVVQP